MHHRFALVNMRACHLSICVRATPRVHMRLYVGIGVCIFLSVYKHAWPVCVCMRTHAHACVCVQFVPIYLLQHSLHTPVYLPAFYSVPKNLRTMTSMYTISAHNAYCTQLQAD